MFQYIICCWFKCKFYEIQSVSIHYMLLVQKSIIKNFILLCFYIICCWFKEIKWIKRLVFNTLYVVGSKRWFSFIFQLFIHYMLLVQILKPYYCNYLFQYIICCWFNPVTVLKNLRCFNTLYVVGSTHLQMLFRCS